MSKKYEPCSCTKISHVVYCNLVRRTQERLRQMDELVATVRAEHAKNQSLKEQLCQAESDVTAKSKRVRRLRHLYSRQRRRQSSSSEASHIRPKSPVHGGHAEGTARDIPKECRDPRRLMDPETLYQTVREDRFDRRKDGAPPMFPSLKRYATAEQREPYESRTAREIPMNNVRNLSGLANDRFGERVPVRQSESDRNLGMGDFQRPSRFENEAQAEISRDERTRPDYVRHDRITENRRPPSVSSSHIPEQRPRRRVITGPRYSAGGTGLTASSGTLFTDATPRLRNQTTQTEDESPDNHRFSASDGSLRTPDRGTLERHESIRYDGADPFREARSRREFSRSTMPVHSSQTMYRSEYLNPDEPSVWTRSQWHRNKDSRRWFVISLLLLFSGVGLCWWLWWSGWLPRWMAPPPRKSCPFNYWLYR